MAIALDLVLAVKPVRTSSVFIKFFVPNRLELFWVALGRFDSVRVGFKSNSFELGRVDLY